MATKMKNNAMRRPRYDERPFPFVASFKGTQRIRYRMGAAGTADITDTDLVRIYGMATTTTRFNPFIKAVRLRSVDVWATSQQVASGAFTPTIARVEWGAGPTDLGSDGRFRSTATIGISEPVHIRAVPPKNAWCGMWHSQNLTSGSVLVEIDATAGSVVDLVYEYTLKDDQNDVAYTVVGATVGAVYFSNLPGATTTALIPLDFGAINF